jgi:hypothetical protein
MADNFALARFCFAVFKARFCASFSEYFSRCLQQARAPRLSKPTVRK